MRYYLDFDRLSITHKLLVMVMVPAMAALLLACSLLFFYDIAILQQSLKNQITLGARFAASQVDDALRKQAAAQRSEAGADEKAQISAQAGKEAEAQLQILAEDPRVQEAYLYDANGNLAAKYLRDRKGTAPARVPAGRDELVLSGGSLEAYHPIRSVEPWSGAVTQLGTLYIRADVSFLQARMLVYGIAVLVVMLLCGLVAYVLSNRWQQLVSRPITSLSLLARMVTADKDYSVRAVKYGDDEIGKLADEFNEMLTEIEKRERALQQAHDQLEERVHQRTRELQREIVEHKRTANTLKQEVEVRKKAEADMHKAMESAEAASRSKGEFLANMSHEIRTPMNGIIGMTELLLNTELTQVQHRYSEMIRRSGRALLRIIGDILDFSKVEAGQLSIEPIAFDFQMACEDVIEMLSTRAEEKGIALNLRYPANAPRRVVGDAGRIRQILTNLVANAIKFTHEGHVLVNVECTGLTSDTAALRVIVEDTGIGTSPQKLEAIFGKYAQADALIARNYGGTGLGLAISKQLVELMGGTIGVTSKEGVGSRFYFTLFLPLDRESAADRQPRANLAGVRILIVDHGAINRQIQVEQVRSWGMRADAAATSSEALDLLKEAAAKEDPYGIALIDEQMPGVRGESLGRSIKTEPGISETLLVLLTAVGQRGDAQRVADLGFSAYLTRPVRQSELMDVLATIWAAKTNGESITLVTRYSVAENRGAKPARSARMTGAAKVLVAEDNYVNQQVAIEILQGLGCIVTLARDGAEAVAMALERPFEIVFMDCQMPNLDGFEATAQLKQRWDSAPHPPIIAMTAHAMKGDRERCIEAGMDDYISKPIDIEGVVAVLRRWLPGHFQAERRTVGLSNEREADFKPAPDIVLDLQQANWVTGGKIAMFRRIALVFLQHMPARIEELRTAVAASDLAEIHRLAHSIQGAAGSLGGRRVQRIAQSIEQWAKDREIEPIAAQTETLQQEFDELAAALEGLDWERPFESVRVPSESVA